jgi:ketosteroid isomerase-like protein
MKPFSKISIILIALSFIVFTTVPVAAQKWSDKQLEVWKNVETYWDLANKQDLEGFLSYFHEDYIGWSKVSSFTGNKASVRKWMTESFKDSKVLVSELSPQAIQIFDDVAIVHYYYAQMTENKEGKRSNVKGRWTDILTKQGNKWVLIGDQGGRD